MHLAGEENTLYKLHYMGKKRHSSEGNYQNLSKHHGKYLCLYHEFGNNIPSTPQLRIQLNNIISLVESNESGKGLSRSYELVI